MVGFIYIFSVLSKVEKILKGSLDLMPSPSPSVKIRVKILVKIQIIGNIGNSRSPLTPDRLQVKRPPPSLQITSNFLVFMSFHMVSLLKRSVWLKILYIQKSEELFLETGLETVVFVKKT